MKAKDKLALIELHNAARNVIDESERSARLGPSVIGLSPLYAAKQRLAVWVKQTEGVVNKLKGEQHD